jgi:hypothetical protein
MSHFIRLVRFSFLILIGRFATLEDPAGLFGGTPPGFQSSGVPVVHDLLCGRLVCRLAP